MLYHMGCGAQRLEGYVNADLHPTAATDVVLDLTSPRFPANVAVDGVFSHAFFEHLRRTARAPHLRALRDALEPEGFVCYLGLPDFRRIAELYLAGGPGVVGPHFDLFNVYRYTHGDPEMNPDESWEAQLHKSLFDVNEIGLLLRDAGFPSYVVFRYVFPGDADATDLTLGFYASRSEIAQAELQAAARGFLEQFDGRFIRLETMVFEDGRSRSRAFAGVTSMPPRRLARRLAYVAAARLARNTHPI